LQQRSEVWILMLTNKKKYFFAVSNTYKCFVWALSKGSEQW
jgi:hypothetical protein